MVAKKWEEGRKSCWWLPDWEVEGVVAAEKRFVGGCPIRKSSRSDGKKDVGSCLNGKSTICSTA